MDNRQVLIPFVSLGMIGRPYAPESYQYHQLALGIAAPRPEEYVHGLITTLTTALAHPILGSLPLDLRTSLIVFRNLRAGLGLVNLNFHDTRRAENHLTLRAATGSGHPTLVIRYAPRPGEGAVLRRAVRTVKRFLWRLGCVVPPGMIHVRPMGASVHYAGTIPMSTAPAPRTASAYCQSHDFDNLYLVDGATFPFLPAKNITFTLMANAVRVAEHAF
jgi:choline dehydrogenase-like flavoprotein